MTFISLWLQPPLYCSSYLMGWVYYIRESLSYIKRLRRQNHQYIPTRSSFYFFCFSLSSSTESYVFWTLFLCNLLYLFSNSSPSLINSSARRQTSSCFCFIRPNNSLRNSKHSNILNSVFSPIQHHQYLELGKTKYYTSDFTYSLIPFFSWGKKPYFSFW